MSVYHMHVCCPWDQKKALDSLEPKLLIVASHRQVLGIEPGVSGRVTNALNL